jgi:hypothetical protein
VIRDTLRALVQPRRALPIVIVMTPMLLMQWRYSRTPMALVIGALLCLAFLVIAPATWRYLFPPTVSGGPALGGPDALFRLGVYGLLGAGVVSGVGGSLPHLLNMPATFLTTRASLVVCVAFFWAGGWGLGRDIDFEQRLDLERERARAALESAERARLLAVAHHLDPHFLFNTLNAIAEWCREDSMVAEAAILRLSALLRTITDGISSSDPGAPTWSLGREVDLVRGLWELHRLRDEGAFTSTIELPPTLAEISVPSLLLLGLAENAVKHGPAAGHRGALSLRIARDAKGNGDARGVVIVVENPGAYRGPRPGGRGVELTRQRARLHFGATANVSLEQVDDEGREPVTRARLFIPTAAAR